LALYSSVVTASLYKGIVKKYRAETANAGIPNSSTGHLPQMRYFTFFPCSVIFLEIEAAPKLQFWSSNLKICSFVRLKA
jgi:hypothetical protein